LLRQKRDVQAQLGPIHSLLLPLDLPAPDADAAPPALPGALSDDDFLAALSTDEAWSTKRRELGERKAAPMIEWARDFLDADPRRKIVLFAHHRSVIETLAAGLDSYGAVTLHGGTTTAEAADAVTRFQNAV